MGPVSACREHRPNSLNEPTEGARWLSSATTRCAPTGRSTRAGKVGWTVLGVAFVTGLILAIAPAPYAIEKPGPVYNTLGTADHDGKEIPLITIPDKKIYPTDGRLDLLTVSLVGDPESRPSWLEVATSWLNPSAAVIPIDEAFPADVIDRAARRGQPGGDGRLPAGCDRRGARPSRLRLPAARIIGRVPAREVPGRRRRSRPTTWSCRSTATTSHDVTELRTALKPSGAGKPVTLGIVRDGADQELQVTPARSRAPWSSASTWRTEYQFPIEVQIQLDQVGGPSAGMMFALGIIDKLTPGAITGRGGCRGHRHDRPGGQRRPDRRDPAEALRREGLRERNGSSPRRTTAPRSPGTSPTGSPCSRWRPSTIPWPRWTPFAAAPARTSWPPARRADPRGRCRPANRSAQRTLRVLSASLV